MTDEKIFRFGPERNLTGIVTLPPSAEIAQKKPALIFLNAGFLHQVGPQRMNVEFCRALSQNNFYSFRFDLSGIGDSPASTRKATHDEIVIDDIKSAMDLLQSRYECDQFVLFGLCTGADNAHKAAVNDKRICGLILLDGYAYPTNRFERTRLASFLSDPKRVATFVLRKTGISAPQVVNTEYYTALEGYLPGWHLPPIEKTIREMNQFVKRDLKLLLIFSGNSIREYNYQGQARDMYQPIDFGNNLQEIFNSEAGHTYMYLEDRLKLLQQVRSWLETAYQHLKSDR